MPDVFPYGHTTTSDYIQAISSARLALSDLRNPSSKYTPIRILKSGAVTIVFWYDGTKTIVKLQAGEQPDDYSAFTAALAKKVFGSNSNVKKIIKNITEIQSPKVKKNEIISASTDGIDGD